VKLALIALVVPLAGADLPRIIYSKSFPGSKPEFVQITVEKSGQARFQDSPQDDQPLQFRLTELEVNEIFGLADKLDRFTRPLEANLKIAFMGMKTFTFEEGGKKTETKFNYSLDLDAQAILDWFERMSESEMHRINLERTARFDRLGVNQILLQLEASWDRKRLVAVDQFLPMLDRVAKNDVYLNMARERAASLAETFRASQKPKAE
jgi:hypothetical protein